MRIQTGCPSCMPCGWFAASWLRPARSPPRNQKLFHERVLDEILQERVVSSRHRRNPRGVKRKMSNFPLRSRKAKPPPPLHIQKAIQILKGTELGLKGFANY